MSDLKSELTQSMRFGYAGWILCKFNNSSSYSGQGSKLETKSTGEVCIISEDHNYGGISANKDIYITLVYEANYEENKDKILYYVDGTLYGWTYYGHDSYIQGCKLWNKDSNPFYIGVCPWEHVGQLYYLKGKVYTTRLYTSSLNEKQVKENYDKTIAYRNYIKD